MSFLFLSAFLPASLALKMSMMADCSRLTAGFVLKALVHVPDGLRGQVISFSFGIGDGTQVHTLELPSSSSVLQQHSPWAVTLLLPAYISAPLPYSLPQAYCA